MPETVVANPAGRRVVQVAALLVALQLGFRAWALYPAWFYVDDYLLIADARAGGLAPSTLLRPYDSQFMPVGRAVAWLVSLPDAVSWPLLATTSLVMQALASAACAWMLLTLFGRRWAVLVPLVLYLSVAMTMPGTMWWAAALNQLPLQAVFFVSVACWVRHLRGDGPRWLALTLAALAVGLLCYVKTLFLVPVLAAIALGWFATGGPVQRMRTVLREQWRAVVLGVGGAAAYAAYYLTTAPQLFDDSADYASAEAETGLHLVASLARTMIGETFTTGVLGGPWHWSEAIAPAGTAAPPGWATTLAWVLVVAVVVVLALRRERTLRAWALVAAYVGADFALLLATRAPVVGAIAGAEYRYLSDATCAVTLGLGLASMHLVGARESSAPRAVPLLTWAPGPRLVVAATVLLAVSGTWSAWSYARIWHTAHPGAAWAHAALDSVAGLGEVDLSPQLLPIDVVGTFNSRANRTDVVLPLLDPDLRFPTRTEALNVVDPTGRVVAAALGEATSSVPGPVPGCGWAVRSAGADIALQGPAVEATWWVRVDYLASQDSGATITAGTSSVDVDVLRGLGSVLLRAEGPFAEVRVDGLEPGVTLCVDRVVVGLPEPSAAPVVGAPAGAQP